MTKKKENGETEWTPGNPQNGNEHFKVINGRKVRLYQSGDKDRFHYEIDNAPGGHIEADTIEEAAEQLEAKLTPKKKNGD
jgi:hypothetical protein